MQVKHGEGNTNSPELKSLPLAYHHGHFLAATLDFTSFFTTVFLGAAFAFLQLGCFGLDSTVMLSLMMHIGLFILIELEYQFDYVRLPIFNFQFSFLFDF